MCCCAQNEHIEFLRKAVRKRINESRALKKSLAIVAKHADGEHKLYRCGSCGSSGRAVAHGTGETTNTCSAFPRSKSRIGWKRCLFNPTSYSYSRRSFRTSCARTTLQRARLSAVCRDAIGRRSLVRQLVCVIIFRRCKHNISCPQTRMVVGSNRMRTRTSFQPSNPSIERTCPGKHGPCRSCRTLSVREYLPPPAAPGR